MQPELPGCNVCVVAAWQLQRLDCEWSPGVAGAVTHREGRAQKCTCPQCCCPVLHAQEGCGLQAVDVGSQAEAAAAAAETTILRNTPEDVYKDTSVQRQQCGMQTYLLCPQAVSGKACWGGEPTAVKQGRHRDTCSMQVCIQLLCKTHA